MIIMKKNEGVLDRVIRAVVGVFLVIAAVFWLPLAWAIVAYVLAAILLVTAATGFCLLYVPFKISTNKKKKKK